MVMLTIAREAAERILEVSGNTSVCHDADIILKALEQIGEEQEIESEVIGELQQKLAEWI